MKGSLKIHDNVKMRICLPFRGWPGFEWPTPGAGSPHQTRNPGLHGVDGWLARGGGSAGSLGSAAWESAGSNYPVDTLFPIINIIRAGGRPVVERESGSMTPESSGRSCDRRGFVALRADNQVYRRSVLSLQSQQERGSDERA
jgi:hypothetical protein